MARAPKDPNAPKRVVNRTPKELNALIGVNEDGKPVVIVASYNPMALLKALKANPDAELVPLEITK